MIRLILRSIWDCGWSAISYAFKGLPADKRTLPFFDKWFGFADRQIPELVAAIKDYHTTPSKHLSKNVLVEWVRTWPQRAAKLGSMVVLLQAAVIWLQVVAIVVLVLS